MERPAKKVGEMTVPIKDIKIGDRIREDLGDLNQLELSIEINGLLQPIIVQQGEGKKYELIDGERRIQVHKRMGKPNIDCVLFEAMDDLRKTEVELELCVKRKGLTFAEEARAVRDIVEMRRKQGMTGGLSKFGTSVKNKDIADSLGMSPQTLSQCLTIAKALDEHPQIEILCSSKNQALKMISRKEFISPNESITRQHFLECFTIQSPMSLLEGLDGRVADLIILHPETVDPDLARMAEKKLRLGGSMILFVEMEDMAGWYPVLGALDMHMEKQPMIWNVKGESTYYSYFWLGKNRTQPIRLIPPHVTHPRGVASMSLKAKAPLLLKRFINCCTEQSGFVVVPGCEDIDTIKIAYDMNRNIRASCSDKVLRDRLIMSSGR